MLTPPDALRFVAFTLLSCLIEITHGQSPEFFTSDRLRVGAGSELSASVRAGDLDGDGDCDLVVANGRHWPQQNFLFLNQGRGRFNVARPLGVDLDTSYTCELADFDGDGDLDIAVANDFAPCLIFLNDGKARFARHCEVGQPDSVRSLTVSDIDSDGDPDLLFTCRGRANRIHFNDGNAQFDRFVRFGTDTDSTIGVAVADLNHDGRNDLILANRDSQPNTILLATGNWNGTQPDLFQAAIPFGRPNTSSRAVATADFNNDGHPDWVTANIDSQNTVWFGDGEGGMLRRLDIGSEDGRSYCVAVADLNNDGQPDIAIGNAGQVNSVFFNEGNGTRFRKQSFGLKESVTYGLCLADVTRDGRIDIAVANSGQPNRIFVNRP